MKNVKCALMNLLAGAFAAASAEAATLTLTAEFDSTIRSDGTNATTTQSGSAVVFAGDTTSALLRSVYSFDLNQPELVGATIDSVTFSLTVRSNDGNNPGTVIDVNLHELSGGFDNGVTWFTRDGSTAWSTAGGDFGTLPLDTISGDPGNAVINSTFDFSSASLTSLTSGAVGGDLTLLLKSGNEDTSARNLFWFRSLEDGGTPPTLTINYTPIPEPSAALLGGIGLIALLRRRRLD